MLRSVIRSAGGLAAAIALGSCTAPNPAYHLEDLHPIDGTDPTAVSDGGVRSEAGPTLAPGCGAGQADTRGLTAVDSVTVDLKGNLYFNYSEGTSVYIGRLQPGMKPELKWALIPMGAPTRGLVVDGARNVLYFTAGMSPPVIQAIDLSGVPTPRTVSTGFTDPNDLAVGYDGFVYVSEQGDGNIYRFPVAGGARIKVTNGIIGAPPTSRPAGIAFAPDRTLVVGMAPAGQLLRIWLKADGTEERRKPFGMLNDWANGLAFDERGRLYVAIWSQDVPKSVVRLDSDETVPVTVIPNGRFSTMVFGRGTLDCKDLYVAEPLGTMRRLNTEFYGLPVP